MKRVKKQYLLGFILIILTGIGLLIGGIIHYSSGSDFIETEATVQGVITRQTGNGIEYQPNMLVFKDEYGNTQSVGCSIWFNYPLHSGDTITIRYKKDDPSYTIVSNVSKDTMSYALMGIGGVLIVAGAALTVKYLCDVKRGKKV